MKSISLYDWRRFLLEDDTDMYVDDTCIVVKWSNGRVAVDPAVDFVIEAYDNFPRGAGIYIVSGDAFVAHYVDEERVYKRVGLEAYVALWLDKQAKAQAEREIRELENSPFEPFIGWYEAIRQRVFAVFA